MRELEPSVHFETARKKGVKEYSSNVSKGQIGYVPSLEGLLKDMSMHLSNKLSQR